MNGIIDERKPEMITASPLNRADAVAESAAFVLCIENNAIRDQALLLIESIRKFTGELKDAEILAFSPRGNGVDHETRTRLEDLSVLYVDQPLNQSCPEYGSANRIYAAAWAARNSTANTLIILDSDTIFFSQPELLGDDFDVAARPVDRKRASTSGGGDRHERYLKRLCEFTGITIEDLPFIEPTFHRQPVRAAYNGGYLLVRRTSGIAELAADIFTRSVVHGLRPRGPAKPEVYASTGYVGAAATQYWGSSQMATSVAVWSTTKRVRHLSRRYNVPMHILAKRNELLGEWTNLDPVHVHYHWLLDPAHRDQALDLLKILGVSPEHIEWVAERTPLGRSSLPDRREKSPCTPGSKPGML